MRRKKRDAFGAVLAGSLRGRRIAGPVILTDRFTLPGTPARVRAALDDVRSVVGCIPGATVTEEKGGGVYAASIGVHYGDTGVRFVGDVKMTDPSAERVVVHAEGKDGVGSIKATGEIRLALTADPADGTAVDLNAEFTFAGILAPLARSATKIVGPQLMRSFAQCLRARLEAAEPD